MIEPHSAHEGASSWILNATFCVPRLRVIGAGLPLPCVEWPLWPLARTARTSAVSALDVASNRGVGSAATAVALGGSASPLSFFGSAGALQVFGNFPQQPSTKVGLRSTPFEDLYVVLAGWDGDGPSAKVSVAVFINPLVSWIWAGGFLLLVGTLITMWPAPVPARQRLTATVPRGAVGVTS